MQRHASGRNFDFSRHMRRLCADMVGRLPALSHVDLSRVAIGFAQTRTRAGHGLQATLTPMRFEAGSLVGKRDGRDYTVQRMRDAAGREMLYILTFYLPRFLDHPPEEKVTTVLHELWHVSPRFDGDLRRFPGRCYAHGPSEKAYDAEVARLAAAWWAQDPPLEQHALLRFSFRQLRRHYGRVVGLRIPNPKLIPIEA